MQKIKSSWFRFWAAVLAFVGVMHSKDADAGRKTVTVTCGGTQSTETNYPDEGECILETSKITTTHTSLDNGDTVQCYCDDTTLLQYQMTCSKSVAYDEKSEFAYAYWSLSQTRGTCKAECTIGATRSCSTSSYTGTQTCTVFGLWESTCHKTSCKSGYLLIDDRCYPECTVDDGIGFEITFYEGSSSSSSTEA